MIRTKGILNIGICGIIVSVLSLISDATAADVVQRQSTTTANRVSTTRPTQAALRRMPTMTVNTAAAAISETPAPVESTTTAPEPVENTSVENKSSAFGTNLAAKSVTETDTSATTLAELIRAQRAALDAADAAAVADAMAPNLSGTGENTCDTILRECMIQRCGTNFTKCVADTDTTFFDKMDTCRRTTNCTGHEYQLFSVEIKADRDAAAKLAMYQATIDCGNNYDTCIVGQCGTDYTKCIGKGAGDNAISKCDSIAKSCVEYDSGMALRTMAIFGELRQNAERQIAIDEQKLYALREQMRSVCTRLGAMFDERSLDCVYTINFYAGDSTLYASKKGYAGNTFDCTQNWFGIDITTFRENAFRATRAQTSASSAMLGSGLGQAAGALTSGAIDRAIDRFTADKALDNAIKECMETWNISESECRVRVGEKSKTPVAEQPEDEGVSMSDTKAYNSETGVFEGIVQDENGKPLAAVQLIVPQNDKYYLLDATAIDGSYRQELNTNRVSPDQEIIFTDKVYYYDRLKIKDILRTTKLTRKNEQDIPTIELEKISEELIQK